MSNQEETYTVSKEQYEFIIKAEKAIDFEKVDKEIAKVDKAIDREKKKKAELEELKNKIDKGETTFKEYDDDLKAEKQRRSDERDANRKAREAEAEAKEKAENK